MKRRSGRWSRFNRASSRGARCAPFITSQLQRDASSKLGFNVRRTMGVAQRLYEGIDIGDEGTDRPHHLHAYRLAARRAGSNRRSARWIGKQLGAQYLPESPNVYKGKKDAQDAHEAIRPTDASRTPESIARYLSDEQLKLYTLIWRRFVASQMVPAVYDMTTAKIAAESRRRQDLRLPRQRIGAALRRLPQGLRSCQKTRRPTTKRVDANKLPSLDGVKALELEKLVPEQHFTEPPPRYNEASLVKELEERGIGRPSTYASIINTIQDREYVVKHGGSRGRFYPTEIGMVVCDLLVEELPVHLRHQVHRHASKKNWTTSKKARRSGPILLNGFYDHFEEELKYAGKKMRRHQAHGEGDQREVRALRIAAAAEVGQVRQLLCLFGLQQEGPHKLHLHQGEHRGQA